jgi:hypothetical protein
MEKKDKKYKLYGWDDGKVYFFDEETRKEWCITDEEELYNRLIKICEEYFLKYKNDNVKSKQ